MQEGTPSEPKESQQATSGRASMWVSTRGSVLFLGMGRSVFGALLGVAVCHGGARTRAPDPRAPASRRTLVTHLLLPSQMVARTSASFTKLPSSSWAHLWKLVVVGLSLVRHERMSGRACNPHGHYSMASP